MKKLFSFAFFLSFWTLIYAQSFAPVGTKWGYNISSMLHYGSYYLESVGDTMIVGKNCRKLLSQKKFTNYPFTTTFFEKGAFFLHERNDSLFEVKNGELQLLFNFKLQVGDSFRVPSWGNLFVTRKVDTLIGTQILKKWQFRTNCNGSILNESNIVFLDKIGALNGIIGLGQFCVYDGIQYSLCYFSNQNIEIGNRCQYTSSNDLPGNTPLSISPNPVSNFLKIETNHEFSNYKVFDLTGKLVQKGIYTEGGKIEVSSLPNGTFILQLIDNQQLIAHRKFVKM
jgi:Secretion system C-terminal sorting domain